MTTHTAATQPALSRSDLNLPGRSGKVRDVYELPSVPGRPPALLIVATDRLSAFDVVLPTPIPGKGRVLTEISNFWFRFIEQRRLATTHMLGTDLARVPDAAFRRGGTTRSDLAGRSIIGRRCRVVPVECVVRGYLEGSGWKDYQKTGAVCGVKLPAGLRQCAKLPEPIFTPATKAPQGEHDENISFEAAAGTVGKALMDALRDRSLAIYTAAADFALSRGIIIADTKFEFGIPDGDSGGEPILIDEALTPDSSRFWPADRFEPGRSQPSYDKQFVREYLEALVARGEWNKTAPGPSLPTEVVERTLEKYAEARDRLTA
ncbi:MAG: phosphoribosylaminoimidazolesuccinocarboxamide synthase [Phycisphaerales bacterium]|nr:phosphoribosylaminoimidazolesuccinocarboxamide synthase [Phycisphaerales bacterium]